jgi:hypothetical protein
MTGNIHSGFLPSFYHPSFWLSTSEFRLLLAGVDGLDEQGLVTLSG